MSISNGGRPICNLWFTGNKTGRGTRSTSLWAHRDCSWQLSQEGILMVQACHTPWQPLQNLPLGHLGKVAGWEGWGWGWGYAVVGGENVGWTTPKRGHPCPCRNLCSSWHHTENTGRGISHVPPITWSTEGHSWAELSWTKQVPCIIRLSQREKLQDTSNSTK